MNDTTSEAHSTIPDLTTCELEPIHLPGAIEPNGGMLVLGEVHTILQASSNCLSILGIPAQALLGMNLANVFSGDSVRRLLSGPGNDGKRSYVSGVRVASWQLN